MRTRVLSALCLLASCATDGATAGRFPHPNLEGPEAADTRAAAALARGDADKALDIARAGLALAPDDPWLRYDEGDALATLGRLDEAIPSLRRAELAFPARDRRGRSVAAYRRALALEFAGYCREAALELRHYAALVRASDPALADDALAHERYCVPRGAQVAVTAPPAVSDEQRHAMHASTEAVYALVAGDYAEALARADTGLALTPDDPWLNYDRGTALLGLGHLDDGLRALRTAEGRFAKDDVWGRSVAIYRRAIALESANRCEEAEGEFTAYASLVRETAPLDAQHAMIHRNFCRAARAAQHRTF